MSFVESYASVNMSDQVPYSKKYNMQDSRLMQTKTADKPHAISENIKYQH